MTCLVTSYRLHLNNSSHIRDSCYVKWFGASLCIPLCNTSQFRIVYMGVQCLLRPSHTIKCDNEAITKTITIKTQRVHILLVELLHAEYTHAHSTNRMHSFCTLRSLSFTLSLQCDSLCLQSYIYHAKSCPESRDIHVLTVFIA